jgi:AcrR family transcriptional regulator
MNRSADSVALRPFGSAPYSPAQIRVLHAALALFAEHGVAGTSIRMMADALGVTKAAIYFQFKTKDEIVLAAARLGFAKLEWALEAAEADESPARAREFLIRQVIENSLEQRHVTRALQHDPVMLRLLTAHEPFQRIFERMQRVMIGEARSPGAWMQVAMLSGAIAAATTHPLVADVEDDTVRFYLMDLARIVLARLDGDGGSATAPARTGARRRGPDSTHHSGARRTDDGKDQG